MDSVSPNFFKSYFKFKIKNKSLKIKIRLFDNF